MRPAVTGRPAGVDQPPVGRRLDLLREEPFPGLALVGLVADHALREQPGERLVEIEIAALLQRPGEEPRIEQMQHGMLDAADILVDRHPVIDRARGRRRPARVPSRSAGNTTRNSKKVSKVSVSRRAGLPQRGQVDVLPGRVVVERIARDRRS